MSEEQHDVTEAISTVNRLLKSARNENEAMIALCTEIAMLNSKNRKLQERLTLAHLELERVKIENERLLNNNDEPSIQSVRGSLSSRSLHDGSSSSSISSHKIKTKPPEKNSTNPPINNKIREDMLVKKSLVTTKADIHTRKESSGKSISIGETGTENRNTKGLGRRMSPFEEQLRDAIKGRFVDENESPINPFRKTIIPNYNPDGPLFPSNKTTNENAARNNKKLLKNSTSLVDRQISNDLHRPPPIRKMASYDIGGRNRWDVKKENEVAKSRTESFLYDLHY